METRRKGCRDVRTLRAVIVVNFWLIVILLVAAYLVMRSGVFYVGADRSDSAPVRWFLSTMSDKSVERHARGIKAPTLTAEMANEGARHHPHDCAVCHGEPGAEKSEIARGLNPEPPDLADSAKELSAEELFWVTKHGLRMTGMPAWGSPGNDEELWAHVAFIKQLLPKISPQEYQALSSRPRPGGREGAEQRGGSPGGRERREGGDGPAGGAGHESAPGPRGGGEREGSPERSAH